MKKIFSIILLIFLSNYAIAQKVDIENIFKNPPQSAKPWVFWYWLHGAVSAAGITADLEAMKEVGIGGAYLMPIKDTNSKIPFQPQVRQLTPEWWAMVKFALQEAKRLKLEMGVHVSDGFALAGGPWITPELSMQKLVWTKTIVKPGAIKIQLQQPEANQNYYKDIVVCAYPANYKNEITVNNLKPVVTASNNTDASFLTDVTTKQTFRSDSNCWIQYAYPQAITVRQVKIKKQNNAYQSQRFIIQQSNDGINFTPVDTLQPPRHGWQDWDEAYTHAVKTFTSKYIRFVWQKEGTEPGSEDLDAAKWKPVLRVQGIYVSDEPIINNYEAKNGSVWRVAANTTNNKVTNKDAVPLKSIINLTKYLQTDGTLKWTAPYNNNWVIVRIGHTSTGAVNSTAGGGKGLECDKFSTEATTLQFNNWFEKFYTETDAALAKEVIKVFHVDSWECGSQNWSKNFAAEFKKKRGYDLLPYLLVMTGTPVTDAAISEKVLLDVRTTIAELVNDKFYATLKNLSHKKNVQFSAESIAPTFESDGLMHYKHADIPMGEFWLNSPTHDKPNDMLDAISGAHIYGKNIVQAEAFTTLRSDWSEHPGSLKVLGDRAFAAGINKLSLHVFMHSPWLDKKPGMTLDGIGLFYQRDQTWFNQSKAWIEYLTRCQALLQLGKPVVDIGVFTGEEIPSRSVLPDRLINTLPGLFGKDKLAAEKKRLLNEGQPQRTIPDGVTHSANMADPENYVDALNGYKYDCFNPDVLLQMKVVNGRVVTPGGASYAVLVIPGKHPMNPNVVMSDKVKNKLKQLTGAGAKIIIDTAYNISGNKNFIKAPYNESSLENLGVKKEILYDTFPQGSYFNEKQLPPNFAINRRDVGEKTIWFVSNQNNTEQTFYFWFKYKGLKPEIYNPVTGTIGKPFSADTTKGLVKFWDSFEPHESKFFVFNKEGLPEPYVWDNEKMSRVVKQMQALRNDWEIRFKNDLNIPARKLTFDTALLHKGFVKEAFDGILLKSWTEDSNSLIKYYSGSVLYSTTYNFDKNPDTVNVVELRINELYNIATVKVNGINCGTIWTNPYSVDIKKAIKPGINQIEIEVTNTWRNRLIGDELMPQTRRTWLNSPYKLKDKPLLPAGIIGMVEIFTQWGGE
ncbi:glycosyl hydrolase [Ferruginibacter sp.]|nr:DNA-binding protein [Ferruginibacter sp.]